MHVRISCCVPSPLAVELQLYSSHVTIIEFSICQFIIIWQNASCRNEPITFENWQLATQLTEMRNGFNETLGIALSDTTLYAVSYSVIWKICVCCSVADSPMQCRLLGGRYLLCFLVYKWRSVSLHAASAQCASCRKCMLPTEINLSGADTSVEHSNTHKSCVHSVYESCTLHTRKYI